MQEGVSNTCTDKTNCYSAHLHNGSIDSTCIAQYRYSYNFGVIQSMLHLQPLHQLSITSCPQDERQVYMYLKVKIKAHGHPKLSFLASWRFVSMFVYAGSTQEEMGALVQQSINDSKISGGDRPVAWDGETRSGAGLQNQLKQIQDSKVWFCLC